MKRVLVVDDERHVVDHIVRTVERELSDEFVVVAVASSGREALEKVPIVRPDIVVMDVRMPGLSGLDTVRELKRRGDSVAFVLSTAYERFDIARDALELGITGYLLKPVVKDKLAQALRAAGEHVDQRRQIEVREAASREKDDQVRVLVAEAFLANLMLGRTSAALDAAVSSWCAVVKPWAVVVAVAFRSRPQELHTALEALLLYKTEALCGPLVDGRCLVFLPLADAEGAEVGALVSTVKGGLSEAWASGSLRFGLADPRPRDQLAGAWAQALGRLGGRRDETERASGTKNFEAEEDFHAALLKGDSERVKETLEELLEPLEAGFDVAVADRYRIIMLLGSALTRLVGLGHLDEASARHWMDFDDLRNAEGGREFCLLARSRLPVITGALALGRHRSMGVSAALEYVRQNYSQPLTLESAADHVGLSPKKLSRLFIDEVGQGFSDYLIDFRIEKAKVLLSLPGTSIKQVSLECGYADPNYFSRLFKKVTGFTPTDFAADTLAQE